MLRVFDSTRVLMNDIQEELQKRRARLADEEAAFAKAKVPLILHHPWPSYIHSPFECGSRPF